MSKRNYETDNNTEGPKEFERETEDTGGRNVIRELCERKIAKIRKKRIGYSIIGSLYLLIGILVNLFYKDYIIVVVFGILVSLGSGTFRFA